VLGTSAVEDGAGVAGGEGGDLGGEKVAEQAAAVVEAEMFAVFGSGVAGGAGPADGGPCGRRFGRKNDGGGAIAEEAGADEDAGVVIEVAGGGADFDADDENPAGAPGLELGGGLVEGGEGGATALADEIEEGRGGRKPKAFGNIAGKAGAEVAGAGGDKEGIDLGGLELGFGQGALGGPGGKVGGVLAEAGHHGIGTEVEGFADLVQGEVAAFDAVFAGEDLAEEAAGFFGEGGEGGIGLESGEHLGLGEGASRNGEAEGVEEHGSVKFRFR
jgi:hypothetical protein